MKKIMIFLFLFIFASPQANQTFTDIKEKNVTIFVENLKKDVDKAHKVLNETKNLIKNFSLYLKRASYDDSTKIILGKGATNNIILNFGYSGHGNLIEPFSGFVTELKFKAVPSWLTEVLKKTLVSLKLGRFVNVLPEDEFLLKFIILCFDKKNLKIDTNSFLVEMFFLFYRLSLVKDFKGLDSFLGSVAGPLGNFIGDFKLSNRSLKVFLDNYWNIFKLITNYDFALEDKASFELTKQDLIESNNWKEITKVCFALGLNSGIEYYSAREKFLKTEKGKELFEKIVKGNNKKDKFKKLLEFNKQIPEYSKIVDKTKTRMIGFLRRIKGIRKFWNKFINKLTPILKPFFDSIGLPFDVVFPKLEEVDNLAEVEKLYKEEEPTFEEEALSEDFYFDSF